MDEKATSTESTQLIIYRVMHEIFASDISSVREVIKLDEVTPVPNSHDYITGVVNIRGKIVPVMNLGKLMKIGSGSTHEQFILLVDTQSAELVGMMVDEVIEIRHVPASEIKEAPKLVKSKVSAEFISGVLIPQGKDEESDEIILLLNLGAIITKSVSEVIEQVKSTREKVEA